jgi:hypothetical protein
VCWIDPDFTGAFVGAVLIAVLIAMLINAVVKRFDINRRESAGNRATFVSEA